ncbi:MAG: type 11 methyltransferase [Methanohalophilus sp.]|nr:MAG: type 11 methyltransferase [Methanohalophilus sp.]
MGKQVDSNHYYIGDYDTKERFISYWHQINEIIKLKPINVLEVGIGNKFVSNYLTNIGINVTSFDFDKQLSPDIVGNINDLPFYDDSFDVIACYEVLEHIDFSHFENSLKEMYRVSKSYVIISLPDVSLVYRLYLPVVKLNKFEIMNIRLVKKLISIPRLIKPLHQFDGEHFWEIGKKNYSLNDIEAKIKSVGFEIIYTYQVFENPYHRFFVLKK